MLICHSSDYLLFILRLHSSSFFVSHLSNAEARSFENQLSRKREISNVVLLFGGVKILFSPISERAREFSNRKKRKKEKVWSDVNDIDEKETRTIDIVINTIITISITFNDYCACYHCD